MKAKFIALNGAMALILANGTVFNSVEKESKPKFLKRVQADVELDLGELDIEELTVASFNKLTADQLNKAAEKETGLLKDLLTLAAGKKSTKTSSGSVEADAAADKKAEKEKAKAEKAEAAAKAKAEKQASKKPKAPRLTAEEAKALVEASAVNENHAVKFSPFGYAAKVEGVIRKAWMDARVSCVYYRIYGTDGKLYNKNVADAGLEIGEIVADTRAAEKEAAAEAKAKAKAEKAEAAAKAKAEKAEAAAKAKAEKETKETK